LHQSIAESQRLRILGRIPPLFPALKIALADIQAEELDALHSKTRAEFFTPSSPKRRTICLIRGTLLMIPDSTAQSRFAYPKQ